MTIAMSASASPRTNDAWRFAQRRMSGGTAMSTRGRSQATRRRNSRSVKQKRPMSCGRSVQAKRVRVIAGSAASTATIGRGCARSAAATMSVAIPATSKDRSRMIPVQPSPAYAPYHATCPSH